MWWNIPSLRQQPVTRCTFHRRNLLKAPDEDMHSLVSSWGMVQQAAQQLLDGLQGRPWLSADSQFSCAAGSKRPRKVNRQFRALTLCQIRVWPTSIHMFLGSRISRLVEGFPLRHFELASCRASPEAPDAQVVPKGTMSGFTLQASTTRGG